MNTFSKKIIFTLAIGVFTLAFSSAHAATKQLCGQNLEYNPVGASANVPKEFRAFSGIWLGKTIVHSEYSSCTAFVVQQVDATGRVYVQQAWGTDIATNGSWAFNPKDIGKTTAPWLGHIQDGTMVLVAEQVTYQLTIDKQNPDKMVGYVIDVIHGRYPVELYRTQRL